MGLIDLLNNAIQKVTSSHDMQTQSINIENLLSYTIELTNRADLLAKEGQYEEAIALESEVAWWQTSGLIHYKNHASVTEFLKYNGEQFFPYNIRGSSLISISPAIVDKLRKNKKRGEISDDSFLEIVANKINSMHTIFHPFTKDECIQLIVFEVLAKKDLIEMIYEDAEQRLNQQYPSIKFRRNISLSKEDKEIQKLNDALDVYEVDGDIEKIISTYENVLSKANNWNTFSHQLKLISFYNKEKRYDDSWKLLQKMNFEAMNHPHHFSRTKSILYEEYKISKAENRYLDALEQLIEYHALKSGMQDGHCFEEERFIKEANTLMKHTGIQKEQLDELINQIKAAPRNNNIQANVVKIYRNFMKANGFI